MGLCLVLEVVACKREFHLIAPVLVSDNLSLCQRLPLYLRETGAYTRVCSNVLDG